MKHCTVCGNTYTDESLKFCLADGSSLVSSMDEVPTQIITSGLPSRNTEASPIRVDIPQQTQPLIQPTTYTAPRVEKKGGKGINLIIGLVIGSILSLGIAVILVAAWMVYRTAPVANVNNADSNRAENSNTAVKPTPDESAILKEKIANLEKKMAEQKSTKQKVPTIADPPANSPDNVTAKANSPGDGFLALRTAPSSETGDRILKIPHGATLTVTGCLPKQPGKKGRWCRVNYNGTVGWAFDGFMTY